MDSLKLSFEAVTPIFLMMLLGYFLKRIRLVGDGVFDAVNKLVFKVFLPTLLFFNIYSTRNLEGFNKARELFGFTIICVVITFLAGIVLSIFICKDSSRRGVVLQSFFRTNFAILGVPLVSYICQNSQGGLTAVMVALVVPLFNILAVVSFEIFSGGGIRMKKILKGIATNPLIIGCALGIVFLIFGIDLPLPIEKTVADVSKVASPLAIITLGAGFTFKSIKGYVKENVIVVFSRLIIVPLIFLPLAAYVGFRGEEFVCLMVAFAGPIAVSSYSTAQEMGGDKTLASQLVVLTSALCIFTLFVWIFVFSSLGII